MTPAVFLDRDGTLIEEVGYLDRLDLMSLFPWTVDAVKALNGRGYPVIVVTNQSGIARGYFDESFLHEVHRRLGDTLASAGATIDRFYYCPHHPDADLAEYRQLCGCRKPQPGMLRQAERDFAIDLSRSFVVGDRWLDVALAQAVGAQGILVRTGVGDTEASTPQPGVTPAAVVPDLMAAVDWILEQQA
jgi:D-glycero-D-manno-heptose 1,7-bisphosphate phosphatase